MTPFKTLKALVREPSLHDPVLARWGLDQLAGGGGLFDTGNVSKEIDPASSESPEPNLMHPSAANARYDVVNDEAIAQAFQEELSKLPPETEESADHSSKAAILNQNWQDLDSTRKETSYQSDRWKENSEQYYGQPGDYGQTSVPAHSQSALGVEDEDKMGHSKHSSSSSARSRATGSSSTGRIRDSPPDYDSYQHGDDEENLKLALALSTSEEQHQLDREVAKRLTKFDSIRHVPRVNIDELPTFDDASLDHARLLERLVLYGLNERQIQGDGNCQFRALSDQLYRTPEHHKFVRKTIVARLKSHSVVYEGYVTMPYSEYLKKMAKSGEWGDHVTLQAAADWYGVKIWLITSFKDTSFIEILPDVLLSNRVIYLSFWAEVHYNSIYPEGDASSSILLAPKKKHWLLW